MTLSHRSQELASVVLVVGLLAAATGAAVYFFLGGDPCKSSARIEFLYLSPLLFGAAGALLGMQRTGRWRIGAASGTVTVLLTGGLLILAALIQWGESCYT